MRRYNTPGSWEHAVRTHLVSGDRFCGLFARPTTNAVWLRALFDCNGELDAEELTVGREVGRYPSLSSVTPAATWYEREIYDLFGLRAVGTSDHEPLVTSLRFAEPEPRGDPPEVGVADDGSRGDSFVIPYGPVRSGVFESIEYLVCTIGEDIEWIKPRVLFKHRGVQARVEGVSLDDAVLVAERTEGVSSVAHAMAFSQAVEQITGSDIPVPAALVRVIHAELERVANHLESTIRHTEAAGQAVAYATLSQHKEQVQRLRSRLCGSRFGRSVVVPGGVVGAPRLGPDELRHAIDGLGRSIEADLRRLVDTPSFIDRLRGTGVLPLELVRRFGALGPVARGSGVPDDVRATRPYGAYPMLGRLLVEYPHDGDALARQYVRSREIATSFHLIRQATEQLGGFSSRDERSWRCSVVLGDGEATGWVEAAQGELLYLVELGNGAIRFVKSRSASFHNLALFASAFPKDVFTDFAFIEASFGVSIAGVAS